MSSGASTGARTGRSVHRWASVAITAGLVGVTFLVWQQVTTSGTVDPIVLPSPSAVWASTVDVVGSDSFPEHLKSTASAVLIGFAIGAVAAIGVALLCDRLAFVRQVVMPYLVGFAALPKIVLMPLLFVWFGIGFRATTALVVLVVFFPVFLNTLTGLSIADEDGARLLRSLGADARQHFRYHQIPSALPLIFTGLKTAVNFAVAAALAAEILGSRHGLGFLIANSGNFLRIDELYATVVIATVFSGAFYLAFEVIDRKVVFWRERRARR